VVQIAAQRLQPLWQNRNRKFPLLAMGQYALAESNSKAPLKTLCVVPESQDPAFWGEALDKQYCGKQYFDSKAKANKRQEDGVET